MTVQALIDSGLFKVHTKGDLSREITSVFCCDLLSVAMGKAPAGACWVTIMGNINTLAVASLTDCSCVCLAEGTTIEAGMTDKAVSEGITLLSSELPIFESALEVHRLLHAADQL